MRIGILTAGGDCPGINATIRGVCKTAINYYGMEVYGIHNGFRGLLDDEVTPLTETSLGGLLTMGGTVLGTSRVKPFRRGKASAPENTPAALMRTIQKHGLDCLVCIGGNGTQKTTAKLAETGINVVMIPKTIDNDVWGTDISFGFDSAVSIATEAIDRLHSTASSHQRVMVIEVMGHKAGWIALHSGMAGGGDIILLPELPFNIHNIGDVIIERLKKGKPYSIVVVAEGIPTLNGKKSRPIHRRGNRIRNRLRDPRDGIGIHPARRKPHGFRPYPCHTHGRARYRADSPRQIRKNGLPARRRYCFRPAGRRGRQAEAGHPRQRFDCARTPHGSMLRINAIVCASIRLVIVLCNNYTS